jgi:hypothetical protein
VNPTLIHHRAFNWRDERRKPRNDRTAACLTLCYQQGVRQCVRFLSPLVRLSPCWRDRLWRKITAMAAVAALRQAFQAEELALLA